MSIFMIQRQYDYDADESIDADSGFFTTREAAQAFIDREASETAEFNQKALSDPEYLRAKTDYAERQKKAQALGAHLYVSYPTPRSRHVDYSVEIVEVEPHA